MTDRSEILGLEIRAAGREVAYPPTPEIGPTVTWRLEAATAAGRRPPFPHVAVWSRRRALAAAAAGLLALLALAFGARYVLGAAEIRVVPGTTPSGPPLGPEAIGRPVDVDRISEAVGFEVALPAGPAPDQALVVSTKSLDDAALLAWAASDAYPAIEGTPWGLVLLAVPEDDELLLKDVNRYDDLREVRVDGRRAYWIDAPHELTVLAEDGPRTFSVRGNVLIWQRGAVTYRLETSLGRQAAIALAETVG
jgi:hypothetical protein